MLYARNKILFLAALLVLVIFIAGCASSNGNAVAPVGPIGGGGS